MTEGKAGISQTQTTMWASPRSGSSEQQPGAVIGEKAKVAHAKPLLTVEQQIAHMKSRGIAFELVSEADAAEHLRSKCQFFRIYAYRKLFPKHIGGKHNGKYVNLDFGNLRTLSNLDRQLRDVLLPMTLDIEHFAKVRLLHTAEHHAEDGYALIRDYRVNSSEEQRRYLKSELKQRRNDPYIGNVVRKYEESMPVWAFCEIISFGTFIDLLRFCADRWGDKQLKDAHYQYKSTVPEGSVRSSRRQKLVTLFNTVKLSGLPTENPAIAALCFLQRLTGAAGLLD